jgi:hypothetical protein
VEVIHQGLCIALYSDTSELMYRGCIGDVSVMLVSDLSFAADLSPCVDMYASCDTAIIAIHQQYISDTSVIHHDTVPVDNLMYQRDVCIDDVCITVWYRDVSVMYRDVS